MITLSKSGNSVTFTFDENSGYLQNGTIDVPVNSLSLITDESDMATFRKSASNDIFVSARYEEFGMTKSELESWYKEYMVGDVGGGIDSGTVQTMIDQSISGKQDTLIAGRNVEITADTINCTLPISAGTGVDSLLMSGSANTASGDFSVAYGKLNSVSGECGLVMGNRNTSGNFAEMAIGQKNISRSADPAAFGHSGNTLFTVGNGIINTVTDANHNAFEIRGNGDIYISDTNASGAYYEKPMIKLQDALDGSVSSGEVQSMIDSSISGKVNTTTYTAYTSSTQTTLNSKLGRNEVLNTVSSSSTAPVQSRILYNELNITETAETTVFDINFGSSRGHGNSTNCPPKARTITYEISGNSEARIDLGFSEINYTDINQEDKRVETHLILNFYSAITDPDDPQYPRNAYLEYDSTEEYGDGGSAISAYTISGTSVTVTLNTFTDYSNPDDPELVEWEPHMLSWNDSGDWSYGDSYGNVTAVAISEPTIVTIITPLKDAVEDVEESLSGKQDTLSAGTNITISGNVISASGGKAVSGGTNISITTGATADTINCTLNAKNGTGAGSIIFGNANNTSSSQFSVTFGSGNKANGIASIAEGENTQTTAWYSHSSGKQTLASGKYSNAEGDHTTASTESSHSEGIYTLVSNKGEHSQGWYNVSTKASDTFGNSGNTLFSVGNGTSTSARHNAFEIRQNGDIYLTKDGQDVKLQDQLGGGEVSSAITSGDTNAVAGGAVYDKFDEVEQVTAAGLNAVNSALGGLKLQQITQSAYDALVTKDASTLYIIVN